jgi:diadenosine tetraphosphate (Ap4A) HIT family hydrolase
LPNHKRPSRSLKNFENDFSLTILDINPYAKVHCFVIPKRHVAQWHNLPLEETESLS